MKKQYIIPIFVPHLGCPNDCVFCNQRSISGQLEEVSVDDVKNTVDFYLKNLKEKDVYKEIAFFGGSFTGIDVSIQEELLKAAYEYVKNGDINSIRVSTRPDYINKDILKMLKKYKVKVIELGVQTSNDYLLDRCKRNHNFEDVRKASKLIRRKGFILGHQMMVGLPESTKNDEMKTAKDLADLKPKMVRIYPVLVIKNTELEIEYNNGEYIPLSLEQAVERCKELYYFFRSKKIDVIRIGLQNTDIISSPDNKESQVVAGPYHEAFGQLVEDAVWYDSIVDRIKKFNVKVKEVEISVNPINVNNIIGHKKENINKLKELYDVDVKIIQDSEIKPGDLDIKILKKYSDFLEESKVKK